MQHGVQVTATEYSLRDRVNMFRLARRVERYVTRKVCGCRGDCQRAAYCAYGTVRASTAFGVPNAHLLGNALRPCFRFLKYKFPAAKIFAFL